MCRTKGAIYAISCPIEGCTKKYYGSTVSTLKNRAEGHLKDVATLLSTSPPKSTTSFTQHLKTAHGSQFFDLIERFKEENNISGRIGLAALWKFYEGVLVKQAKVKFRGTINCTLCGVERGVIWQMMRNGTAMNQNCDWHGFCRHGYKSRVTNFVEA